MKREQIELNAALEQAKQGNWEGANDILKGFGIEEIECAGCKLKYINTGDTYDETICVETNGSSIGYTEPYIGSWGAWYEDTENEYCEVEGVIRCGYCNEFTPIDEDIDWQETICQYCGNLVGG